ncbi:MAG: hypothetical protein JWN69_1201 [Alphaproteobacteria bacterium]|nr:hypothetical protein [Alphaproteobacteria bacterium]
MIAPDIHCGEPLMSRDATTDAHIAAVAAFDAGRMAQSKAWIATTGNRNRKHRS